MRKLIFIAIFFMIVADAFFTTFGARIGVVEEANPLLERIFYTSPMITSTMVVLFDGLLLYLIYKFQHKIRWINYGLGILFIAKLYIVYLHLNWIRQII